MTLASGTRLGPYEILGHLGAGGMGEVYRARDTRLGREVAVKVLPSRLQGDAEMRLRFEREARAISSLSHPNICALHDVGSEGGTEYLVMELLDGESLAARLVRGPLSTEQALRIGAEICAALDAAHRGGIVHRDLKPANVMLTRSGTKLLDFGLARLREQPGVTLSILETAAPREAPLTEAGTVLGTLAYMAPEQLEGKKSGAAADIFSFGAVLHEMLTGTRAFSGDTRAALISSILTSRPPPVSSSRAGLPAALDAIVSTSLEKDPEDRWQSAADVGRLLKSLLESPSASARRIDGSPRPGPSGWLRWLPWLVASAALIALALLGVRRRAPARAPHQTIRFSIATPPNGGFGYSGEETSLAVSPDGSLLAYAAWDPDGGRRLWLRPLPALESSPVKGTEGAASVFWSPDGRSIGFFAGSKLKRFDLPSTEPVTICDVLAGGGKSGTWGRNDQILFSAVQGEAIYRVSASGGTPEALLRPDRAKGENRTCWPSFLPDGERFLYLSRTGDGEGRLMLSGPGQAPRPLMPVDSVVQYAGPGFLVYVKEGVLLARPFDAKAGRLLGNAVTVAAQVRYFLSTGDAAFATSASGTLVYQSGEAVSRLAWFDRTGKELGTIGPKGDYLGVAIAPDEKRILFDRALPRTGTYDIWSFDLERDVETRVTSNPVTSEFGSLWLPDRKSIVYSTTNASTPNLFRRDLATGHEEPLVPSISFQVANDVTRDGRTLVYGDRTERGNWTLAALPLDPPGKPVALFPSPFNRRNLTLSPSGNFAAFRSDESGLSEAYVAPFPGPGETTRISTAGVRNVRWSPDGTEILLLSYDKRVISVPVRTSASLSIGKPAVLFTLKEKDGWSTFDVSPDGKRFLAVVPEVVADRLPLSVVVDGIGKSPD